MTTRVTQGSLGRTVLGNLQSNLARMQRLQGQLSSGKQLSRPSDSPTGTASALQYRADARRAEQFSRNAQDALGWLGTADGALTSSLPLVGSARNLVLQGMNATADASSRAALAAEIDGIRESLLGLANTTYLDRPVFAGTAATAAAYDAAGSYVPTASATPGGDAAVERTVAPGTKVKVNLTGPEIFGTGPTQLFAVLSSVSAKLKANSPDLAGDLADLDAARLNVSNRISELGARYNRVETMRTRADDDLMTLRDRLSEVEDVDLPKTMIDLQMQELAYKSALAAGARVVQPSLLDFLR